MLTAYSRLRSSLWQPILLLVFSVAGLGWMVFLCLHSPGMEVQDEIAHFNISRHAWSNPVLILSLWGRPFNTLVYMLPALHSWLAARFFSICLSAVTLGVTILVAKEMQVKRLFLIPLLFLFQPWVGSMGFTAVTEVPFSLLLVTGMYFGLLTNFTAASFVLGLLPLTRHEGIAVLGLWCVWLVYQRRWKALLVALIPYFLFNLVYFGVYREWAAGIFTAVQPTLLYGSGSWFHFVKPTLQRAGYFPVVLSLLAIPALIRHTTKGWIFIFYASYFLIQTFIFKFGLFASGGYSLFLMPLAPGFAVGAALGLEGGMNLLLRLENRLQFRFDFRWLEAGVLLALIAGMLVVGFQTKPYPLAAEETALQEAAGILHELGAAPTQVYSTHAYMEYLYDLPPSNWLHESSRKEFPAGSYVVWDGHYSDRWGLELSLLSDPGSEYELVESVAGGSVYIFYVKSSSP